MSNCSFKHITVHVFKELTCIWTLIWFCLLQWIILFNSACIFHLLSYSVSAVCLRGWIQRESRIKSDTNDNMMHLIIFVLIRKLMCVAGQQRKKENKKGKILFRVSVVLVNKECSQMLCCELFLIWFCLLLHGQPSCTWFDWSVSPRSLWLQS